MEKKILNQNLCSKGAVLVAAMMVVFIGAFIVMAIIPLMRSQVGILESFEKTFKNRVNSLNIRSLTNYIIYNKYLYDNENSENSETVAIGLNSVTRPTILLMSTRDLTVAPVTSGVGNNPVYISKIMAGSDAEQIPFPLDESRNTIMVNSSIVGYNSKMVLSSRPIMSLGFVDYNAPDLSNPQNTYNRYNGPNFQEGDHISKWSFNMFSKVTSIGDDLFILDPQSQSNGIHNHTAKRYFDGRYCRYLFPTNTASINVDGRTVITKPIHDINLDTTIRSREYIIPFGYDSASASQFFGFTTEALPHDDIENSIFTGAYNQRVTNFPVFRKTSGYYFDRVNGLLRPSYDDTQIDIVSTSIKHAKPTETDIIDNNETMKANTYVGKMSSGRTVYGVYRNLSAISTSFDDIGASIFTGNVPRAIVDSDASGNLLPSIEVKTALQDRALSTGNATINNDVINLIADLKIEPAATVTLLRFETLARSNSITNLEDLIHTFPSTVNEFIFDLNLYQVFDRDHYLEILKLFGPLREDQLISILKKRYYTLSPTFPKFEIQRFKNFAFVDNFVTFFKIYDFIYISLLDNEKRYESLPIASRYSSNSNDVSDLILKNFRNVEFSGQSELFQDSRGDEISSLMNKRKSFVIQNEIPGKGLTLINPSDTPVTASNIYNTNSIQPFRSIVFIGNVTTSDIHVVSQGDDFDLRAFGNGLSRFTFGRLTSDLEEDNNIRLFLDIQGSAAEIVLNSIVNDTGRFDSSITPSSRNVNISFLRITRPLTIADGININIIKNTLANGGAGTTSPTTISPEEIYEIGLNDRFHVPFSINKIRDYKKLPREAWVESVRQ